LAVAGCLGHLAVMLLFAALALAGLVFIDLTELKTPSKLRR
jgi:hypothetical protein